MNAPDGAARPLSDLKEALSSARKPDITHVRTPLLNYTARGCEYGDDVYVRANYLRPVAPGGYTGTPTPEDFKRCRAYMRALLSHGFKVIDAMERHQATDPDLADIYGMQHAVYAIDEDASETATRKGIGPSFLPHLAHLASSLNMVLTQAVACGLLPADPGRTWGTRPAVAAPEADAARTAAREASDAATSHMAVAMRRQGRELVPDGEIGASAAAVYRTAHDILHATFPASDCARGTCSCTARVPIATTNDPGPVWPVRPEGPL